MMPRELYLALRAMWTDEELRGMRPDYRRGMLKDWVKRFCRLFVASIFKWVQAPQAVHLGPLDLDRERALQLPVVLSTEWLEIDAIDGLPD
jgi:NAD+ synthase (glutamine-hydrolysing)